MMRTTALARIELLVATLPDRPGTLAEAARRLANAGVNIEAALPTGMSGSHINIALATDDPEAARTVLGERVLSGFVSR